MPAPQLSVDACRLRCCIRSIRGSSTATRWKRAAHLRCSTLAAQTQDQSDYYYMGLALQQAAKAFECEEVPIGALIVSGSEVVSMSHNETEQRRNPLCHAELMCIMSAADKLQAWRLQDATLYCTLEPCPMCAGAILQARLKRLVYGAKQPRLGADGSWVSLFPQQQEQEKQTQQLQSQSRQQQSSRGPQQGITGLARPPSTANPVQLNPKLGQHLADLQAKVWQQQQADLQRHQQQCYQDCIVPSSSHPFHPDIVVTSGVREEECRAIMQLFFKKRREQQKALKTLQQPNKRSADIACFQSALLADGVSVMTFNCCCLSQLSFSTFWSSIAHISEVLGAIEAVCRGAWVPQLVMSRSYIAPKDSCCSARTETL